MVYAALVQIFVSFGLVSVLVSYSYKQKASLSTIDGYLPNGFIKALVVKFLSDWAKANFPGLFLKESFVKLLAQLDDLDLSGGSGQYSLHPELSIISLVLLGRQNGCQNVLSMMGIGLFI